MLITFLMLYRGRPETNNSLEMLFKSIKELYNSSDIEILVRMDLDDPYINKLETLGEKYALPIRIFKYHRWEGRWSCNYDYSFLFTRRNPNTKWIGFLTDDCVLKRNIVSELTDRYHIIGDFKSPVTKEKLDGVKDYTTNAWTTPEYICAYPIVSTKLIEIMGNMGYQVNIDSTLALINVMMYIQHGLILAKHIKEFIIRENVDRKDNYGEQFNRNWLMTDSDMPSSSYFFTLMEQTIQNIYLNLK